MKLIVKSVVLLLLLVAAFVVNAYASSYFAAYFFPRVIPRPYMEMVSAAIAGGIAAAAVTAWPLVRIYARRAWLAALVVAAPVVYLRASDLLNYAGTGQSDIIVMSWVELIVYPVLILLGVALLAPRGFLNRDTHGV